MLPHTVRIQRVIRAKPEKIYYALLDPDAICKWMPPNGYVGKVLNMEAREGGSYNMSYTNIGTGHSHSFGGTFLELIPNEKIRRRDHFESKKLRGDIFTTFSLKRITCGTELHVEQAGIPHIIPVEACLLGWQESIMLLSYLVEANPA